MDFNDSVSKKKKKSKKMKLEEPVVDTVTKKNKKRHDSESPSSQSKSDMKLERKKQKREMNNNRSNIKESDNSLSSPLKELDKSLSSPKRLDRSFTSVESTPEGHKKKKRKSTLEEVNNSVNAEHNSENDDLSMLSEFQTPAKKKKLDETEKKNLKENQKLINLILEQVKPELTSFAVRMSSVNFEKIAENFEHKTAKDCEIQLNMLIDKIPKKKCLHQVLSETLEELPKEKSRSTNNFGNFLHLNAQEIEEELEKGILGETKLTVAAAMWKNLSKEDKKAYILKSKKAGKMDGQSSLDLYHQYLKKKDSKAYLKDSRLKWTQLSEEKKIKFIKKSAKIMKNVLEERNENDDVDYKRIKGPTKEDIALLLNYYEAPKNPYKSVALFSYCKQGLEDQESGSNVLFHAIKVFNELSKEKQAEWTEKHKKALKKFEKTLEEWKEKQDEITIFIYDISKNPPKSEKKRDLGKSPTKKEQKSKEDQLKKVEMPINTVNFKAEPSVPPLNPATLYAKEVEKNTGEKLNSQMSKEKFSALDKLTQVTFVKKIEKIREVYINGLLDFVDKMVVEQKKLFLGLKRIRYMRLLGQDIFEEKYPNEVYPVYVRPTKEVVVKQEFDDKIDEEEQNEEEEEQNEEEEEEDEESSPSPPKKKIKDYSSRKAEKAPSKKKSKKKRPVDEPESSEDDTSYIY